MWRVRSGAPDVDANDGLIDPRRRPRIPEPAPQSVADLLVAGVAERPDAEALVGRHARYSFAALDREVNRAAHGLLSLGVRPGDRVAGCMGNHTELVVALLACMRIGAIWLGVNRALAPPEKAYLLEDAGASVFIGDREACDQVASLETQPSALRERVLAEPGDPASAWRGLVDGAPEETRPDIAVDPFGPAAIAYTSGTTGFPKGAVHSQHNMLMPGAVSVAQGRSTPEIRTGVCLPITLLNLMILGPVLTAQAGTCCVLMDRIDPLGIAEWVREERLVTFSGVPAIFHDLLTHPEVTPGDLATLTKPGVGGASCPEAFRTLFRERFGVEVAIGYGLTEAPTSVTSSLGVPFRPGFAGVALPQLRVAILDASGNEQPHGEHGEICVGPSEEGPFAGVYTPMLGYWKRPEASAEALAGGWLHTGDIGSLDADGRLYVHDRKSDLIVRGGANVYPAEVERVLHEDARVSACAVLGIPDARLGERVVAAVQLRSDAQVSVEALRAHCAENLARYKVPDEIRLVADLPRTPMGKIRKRDLRTAFVGEPAR